MICNIIPNCTVALSSLPPIIAESLLLYATILHEYDDTLLMNKPRSVCDISDELLDQIIDRVDAHFKAPTTNVDCDDQRSEVTPL